MFRLIESIRIENRIPHLMSYHNRRFNNACKILYNLDKTFDLNDYIFLPANLSKERHKFRILFDGHAFETRCQKYHQRKIESVNIVTFDKIAYPFKTTERYMLEKAYNQRNKCDDVLIVKNGLITDGFVSNILLYDGGKWVTPANPLLKGVQREYLIDSQSVIEKDVSIDDIYGYTYIKLINAMVPFERAEVIDIRKGVFGI